jgi:hypothetical protein
MKERGRKGEGDERRKERKEKRKGGERGMHERGRGLC